MTKFRLKAVTQSYYRKQYTEEIEGLELDQALQHISELRRDAELYKKAGWNADGLYNETQWKLNISNELKVLNAMYNEIIDKIASRYRSLNRI